MGANVDKERKPQPVEPRRETCTLTIDDSSQNLQTDGTDVIFDRTKSFDYCANTFFTSIPVRLKKHKQFKIKVSGGAVLRIGLLDECPAPDDFVKNAIFEKEDGFGSEDGDGSAERCLYLNEISYLQYGAPGEPREYLQLNGDAPLWIYVIVLYGSPKISAKYDGASIQWATFDNTYISLPDPPKEAVCGRKTDSETCTTRDVIQSGHTYLLHWDMRLHEAEVADKKPEHGYIRIGLLNMPPAYIGEGNVADVVLDNSVEWCFESAVRSYPYSGKLALSVNVTEGTVTHNVLVTSVGATKTWKANRDLSTGKLLLVVELSCGSVTIEHGASIPVKQMFGSIAFVKNYTQSKRERDLVFTIARLGHIPAKIFYGADPTSFVVEFEDRLTPQDITSLRQEITKNITILKETKSIQVIGAPQDMAAFEMEMFFSNESMCGGGTMKAKAVEDTWVIDYESAEVARQVYMTGEYSIEGNTVKVLPYYTELGCASNYGKKPVFNMEPLPVCLDIYDEDKVSFVRERPTEVQHLKAFLKKADVSLIWKDTEETEFITDDDDDDEDDENTVYLHTNLTGKDYEKLAKWKKNAKETLETYFSDEVKETTFKVEANRWDNALLEAKALKKVHGFDLHIDDENHTVRVIASKRTNLQKISMQIGKVMPTIEKESIVFKDERAQKYLALEVHGQLDNIGCTYKGTKFSVDKQKPEVICTGPKEELDDLRREILSLFMRVQVISITIQKHHEQICNRARSELSRVLQRSGLSQHFKVDQRSISLYMFCETGASVRSNQEILKSCLNEVVKSREISLQKEHMSVFSSAKWKTFSENLEKENVTCVTFQRHNSVVKVHALKTNVDIVCKNIQQFLVSQSLNTETLLVTHNIAEYLLEHGLSANKDANCQVDMKGYDVTGKILLKGDKKTKEDTRSLILAETKNIKAQWLTLSKPWLASVVDDISIDRLAARHHSVISVDIADTFADVGIAALSMFKRHGTAVIVKQDNITRMSVDVVVSAADLEMQMTSRIAQAIVEAGGHDIQRECSEYLKIHGQVEVGRTFSTTAGILPCCRVVHAFVPDWEGGNKNEETILKTTIKSVLKLTDQEGYNSVAIPVMSYGSKKFPIDKACEHTLEALRDYFDQVGKTHISTVYLCDITKTAVDQLSAALEKTTKGAGWTFFKHGKPLSVEVHTEVSDPAPQNERGRDHPKSGIRWGANEARRQKTVQVAQDDDDDDRNGESDEDGGQQMDDIFADGLPYTIPITAKLRLHIVKGAIESHQADVLVCPTFHYPDLSGAVANAIKPKAGQQFLQECSQLGTLDFDEVKRVSGGPYSNIYLTKIETGWTGASWKRIYDVVRRSLEGASKYKQSSIVFPTFGTGMSKYPADKLAEAMVKSVTKFAAKRPDSTLNDVTIVVYHGDVRTITMFETCIPRLLSTPSAVGGAKGPLRDTSKRGGAQRVRKRRSSKYKMPRKTSDHSETDDFVVFKVISKVPDKVIQDSIDDMIEQEFVTEELPLDFEKDEDQLSNDENKLLETVAEKHCIKIAIEVRDKKPSLKMFGLKSKVRKAQETFNHIVYIQFPETRRKKKMANYVKENFQWYYDDHGNVKQVDAACNLDMYMGYIKGEDFTYKKGDTVYKVLVRDLKEHPVRDPNKKRQLYLKNKLSKDVGLPDGWKIKISGAEYEEVELSMNDIEFNDVKAKFINGGCKASKFERIVRIENKFLWQHYQTKKEHMERQNPKGVQNERELWHGTDIDTAQIIVKKGYDRGFVGKNAAYFGRGVYFAVTSEYSGRNTYAKEDNKGVRRMFLNKVLTGEYTKVAEDAGVLPVKDKTDRHCILYDSAVNDMNNIAMFVIFHDTQAYPQYLVEYKA